MVGEVTVSACALWDGGIGMASGGRGEVPVVAPLHTQTPLPSTGAMHILHDIPPPLRKEKKQHFSEKLLHNKVFQFWRRSPHSATASGFLMGLLRQWLLLLHLSRDKLG